MVERVRLGHKVASTICCADPPLPSLGVLFLLSLQLEEVDLLLVTHFHMDHVACLPYLTEHTMFKGRVFMTHPTKAVMRMLLLDYVRKHQVPHSPRIK